MDDIDAEFHAALRRTGLHVPPERMEAMQDAYGKLRQMLAPLAEPLGYADEPATWPRLRPAGDRA